MILIDCIDIGTWIKLFSFMKFNFVILLNKMCCVDDDEFGWDPWWLNRVVKWYRKCKFSIVNNLGPPGIGETLLKFRWIFLKKLSWNFKLIVVCCPRNWNCYTLVKVSGGLIWKAYVVGSWYQVGPDKPRWLVLGSCKRSLLIDVGILRCLRYQGTHVGS
jgi:hypothetical protein